MGLGGLSYKNESHLKKKIKKIKPNGRIPYDPRILCDLTRFYVRSYHFCDLVTILNFLVRWDRKIMRFYDPDHDFDNHGANQVALFKLTFQGTFCIVNIEIRNRLFLEKLQGIKFSFCNQNFSLIRICTREIWTKH